MKSFLTAHLKVKALARLILWQLLGLGLILLVGCSMLGTTPVPVTSAASVPAAHAANETVNVWLTNTNLSKKLAQQAPVAFGPDTGTASGIITVDPSIKYQRIVGFGASFTDSAALLMYTKLSPAAREAAMRNLFDPTTGLGLNCIRQPMGASDLARNIYSYAEMPARQSDINLANFSIDHDRAYIIPMLKQAQS